MHIDCLERIVSELCLEFDVKLCTAVQHCIPAVTVTATLRLVASSVEYDRNDCVDYVPSLLCLYAFPMCSDRRSDVVATSRGDLTTTSRRRQRRPIVTRVCREDCELLQQSLCQGLLQMITRLHLTGMAYTLFTMQDRNW